MSAARATKPAYVGAKLVGAKLPRLDVALREVERLEAKNPDGAWLRAGWAAQAVLSSVLRHEDESTKSPNLDQLLATMLAVTGPLSEPRLTRVILALVRVYHETDDSFERAMAADDELRDHLLERVKLPKRGESSLIGRVEVNRADERLLRAELARIRKRK